MRSVCGASQRLNRLMLVLGKSSTVPERTKRVATEHSIRRFLVLSRSAKLVCWISVRVAPVVRRVIADKTPDDTVNVAR